jgi:hypothetical protein
MVLDVAVFGLSVLATDEIKASCNSTSPPVTADNANYGL